MDNQEVIHVGDRFQVKRQYGTGQTRMIVLIVERASGVKGCAVLLDEATKGTRDRMELFYLRKWVREGKRLSEGSGAELKG